MAAITFLVLRHSKVSFYISYETKHEYNYQNGYLELLL